MSEYELQNKINGLNEDIRILRIKKTKYDEMKKKIKEAIQQLAEASKYANKAYLSMKSYYKSMVKAKEDRDFEEISSEINKQQNQLNQVIQTSNEQIKKIDLQIDNKTTSINYYRNQINAIINARIAAANSASNNSYSTNNSYSANNGYSTNEYYKNSEYNGPSIVDALKSVGLDSAYSNRKTIAETNGIKNYKGTAEQNLKLLDLFKKEELKK